MSTLFIAAGPLEWASSRFRLYWPAAYMPEVSVTTFDQARSQSPEVFDDYDVIVLQKHSLIDHQRAWKAAGKTILWDACDPMWWFSPAAVRDLLELVDGVTVATEALRTDFLEWYEGRMPVHVLPDRMEPAHYNRRREHTAVDPVRLIWFGISVNRYAIVGAWANLARLAANGYRIELTICDDHPGLHMPGIGNEIPVYWQEWSLEHEAAVLAAHDIALLPPYPGPWGVVKSNNKALTAAMCGLPVATGFDYCELVRLVEDHEYRRAEVDRGYHRVQCEGTSEFSAHEWRKIIAEVRG